MSTHVDGGPPPPAPRVEPDDAAPLPAPPPEARAPAGAPAPDSGALWVRAEMQRRMAANRSTGGRHARRGVGAGPERRPADAPAGREEPPSGAFPAYASPAELPENYVPRHSVQTPGPAAEPAGPLSGPIPVVGGPSLPPNGMPVRRRRGGPGTPLQVDGPAESGPWSGPGVPLVPPPPPGHGAAQDGFGGPPPWAMPPAAPPRDTPVPPGGPGLQQGAPAAVRPGAAGRPSGAPPAPTPSAPARPGSTPGTSAPVAPGPTPPAPTPSAPPAPARPAPTPPAATPSALVPPAPPAPARPVPAPAPSASSSPSAPTLSAPLPPAPAGVEAGRGAHAAPPAQPVTPVVPAAPGGNGTHPPDTRERADTPASPRRPARRVSAVEQLVPAGRTYARGRTATPRPLTPRSLPVIAPAPDDGSTRVRVVLSERRGSARPVRTIKEVQEGTAVGELLRRDLIRSQLTVTLRFAALAVLVLGALPALFALLPQLARFELLGLRLPWLLLGVLVYPFLVLLAWRYTRTADRVEQNFADHVQD